MNNVVFKPWVGKYYKNKSTKILVLGESHYLDDYKPDETTLELKKVTSEIIKKYLKYKNGKVEHEKWMNTFKKFTNVILATQVDITELVEFWNSVVFYNYVQEPMSGPRLSPTTNDFKMSALAFFEVLKKYQPDIIIAWGDRLWEHLPNDNGEWIKDTYKLDAVWFYNIVGKKICVISVYHPSSSAFNKETENLQLALRWVEQRK
jgi:hypothetical protein